MSTKMVLVGPDYIEVEAVESVTPRMAALAAMPFGPDNYGKKRFRRAGLSRTWDASAGCIATR